MQDFLEKNNRALAAKTFFRDFFAWHNRWFCFLQGDIIARFDFVSYDHIQPLSSSGAPDFSSEIPDSIIFTKKAKKQLKRVAF